MSCKNHHPHCRAKCFKILLLAIAGIAALGFAIMLLWNWLLPSLFTGAQPIGYWQALGIFVLSKILFGCHGHGRWRRHQHWEQMTPEERAQLKGRFASRWSQWCKADKTEPTTDGSHDA